MGRVFGARLCNHQRVLKASSILSSVGLAAPSSWAGAARDVPGDRSPPVAVSGQEGQYGRLADCRIWFNCSQHNTLLKRNWFGFLRSDTSELTRLQKAWLTS